jgi:hypothetical protein
MGQATRLREVLITPRPQSGQHLAARESSAQRVYAELVIAPLALGCTEPHRMYRTGSAIGARCLWKRLDVRLEWLQRVFKASVQCIGDFCPQVARCLKATLRLDSTLKIISLQITRAEVEVIAPDTYAAYSGMNPFRLCGPFRM